MELPGTLETPDVKPSEDGALAKPFNWADEAGSAGKRSWFWVGVVR